MTFKKALQLSAGAGLIQSKTRHNLLARLWQTCQELAKIQPGETGETPATYPILPKIVHPLGGEL